MKFRTLRTRTSLVAWVLLVLLIPRILFAQNPLGSVSGQISDPSGAAVPTAGVSAVSSSGKTKAGVVHADGTYEINGLDPGTYTVNAGAKGFQDFQQQAVQVAAGKTLKVDIALQIAQEVEQVQVTDQSTKVSVNPEENATALVIKGENLNALSDDPDELESELDALAGPAAGPNGGQIYVDGFTAGQLPPKADILEIRINQNPFSAEYDKLGYGRIEITTRPGASQFHGQLMESLDFSPFDTRNPFAVNEPGFHTDLFNGNVGGPLGKKASFFFNFMRRGIDDNSLIAAEVLGPAPTYTATSLNQAVPTPRSLTNVSPRFDFQLAPQNVLSVRYQFYDVNFPESGVGQLSLATQGLKTHTDEHTLQISDMQVFSAKMLNRLRFQYLHDDTTTVPQTLAPTISVLGAFTGGGNSSGTSSDIQNHYELQNLTSLFMGKHTLVVGGRLRDEQDYNSSTANFLGTFTFPNLTAYAAAEACVANGGTNCSGATQFSITQGIPLTSVNLFDVGLFAQDNWKVRSNMTLSLGLRWESQTDISDHSDFAPRVGFAWGVNGNQNKAAKTILRAGFGIFYDRFQENLVLESERYNGITQQQFLITSPSCFPTPSNCSLSASNLIAPTRYEVDPHLRAPYTIQSAVSMEQQVSKSATVSVTYLNSHGTHQLITNDINAPLPGTFPLGNPQLGARPYGTAAGNIDDFQSVGLFNQNQLVANFNVRLSNNLSLGGFYTLSYANADSSGNSASLIMDPYDINLDYGRAPFDVRNRVVIIGNWNLPHRIAISPFLVAASGSPFNVTVDQDLFGTGAFNGRPQLALTATCPSSTPNTNPVCFPLGTFNVLPPNTQSIIAPYQYDNPGQFTFNLRLAKTWSFGKETNRQTNVGGFGGGPSGGGRRGGGRGLGGGGLSGSGGGGLFGGSGTTSNQRFNLTASISARNVFNDVNLGPRIGNVSSPLFDQSNSIGGLFGGGGWGGGLTAANRRLDFQVIFSF